MLTAKIIIIGANLVSNSVTFLANLVLPPSSSLTTCDLATLTSKCSADSAYGAFYLPYSSPYSPFISVHPAISLMVPTTKQSSSMRNHMNTIPLWTLVSFQNPEVAGMYRNISCTSVDMTSILFEYFWFKLFCMLIPIMSNGSHL